jgi:hypothetical protein
MESLNTVFYAVMVLASAEENAVTIRCERERSETAYAGSPLSTSRPTPQAQAAGGRSAQQRPAMLCRERLEEMPGHTAAEQQLFPAARGAERVVERRRVCTNP